MGRQGGVGVRVRFHGCTLCVDAIAVGETAVWSLSAQDSARMQLKQPVLANKLMVNLVRQLSSRLVVTNDEFVYSTRDIG